MVLHLFTLHNCFDLASFLTLIAGVATMPLTTLSGWLTWQKGHYHGVPGGVFVYKIRVAWAMIALCVILIVWHTFFLVHSHSLWHTTYGISVMLLLVWAIVEGHYGGRLTHR